MSMLNQNSSSNKLNKKVNASKPKTNNLLLTDFNKFSLFNCNSKTTKKKLHINNKTYSNNSIKNQKKKNYNTKKIINNYNNINNNINNFKIKTNSGIYTNNSNNNINQIMNNNNNMKEKKSIDILDINNIPRQSTKTIKCNSVNNLIGININVNYMNKNYSINKIRPNSYMTNYLCYY